MKGVLRVLALLAVPSFSSAQEPACARCNVVFVCLDTMRADHLTSRRTPGLYQFSESAVRFEQAVSAAPWTLPSVASILTGRWPAGHGLANVHEIWMPGSARTSRIRREVPTLAEVLKKSGYRTAAFTGGGSLAGAFGFSRGFEIFSDAAAFGGVEAAASAAEAWLREGGAKPHFLFVQGYDLHGQFSGNPEAERTAYSDMRKALVLGDAPEADRRTLRRAKKRYRKALRSADARLTRFLQALPEKEKTIVVFFSDHGEELGERGGVAHGLTLFDEALRVPLVIRIPGLAPRSVSQQVRTVDIFPTVLSALGLARGAAPVDGSDLTPILEGDSLDLPAFSETEFMLGTFLRSVRRGGWKLIEDGFSRGISLYHLSEDPGEKTDVSARFPDRAAALQADLAAWGP